MFDRFITLVDLMCIETLFVLNKRNIKDMMTELYKERRDTNSSAIFTLWLSFAEG